MLERKGLLPLSLLVSVVLILTSAAARRMPATPVLGALAPFLIVGLTTWYLIILIVERNEIIEAIANILKIGGQRERSLKGFWLATIVYSVIILLAIVVLWVVFPQPLRRIQDILLQIGIGAPANAPTQQYELEPIAGVIPVSSLVYYTVFVLGTIFALSAALLLGGIRLAMKSHQREPEGADLDAKIDVAEVIHQTIAGLKSARDYHETILQCYRKMCDVLSNSGFGMTQAETAREFAETVSSRLRVGAEAVKGLTFLFEEARYSSHEMSEDKRVVALGYLESLEQTLAFKVGARS